MQYLIAAMIFSGSALMVYNIIRYGQFIKRNTELDKQSASAGILVVPMLLLVFFLVGYIVVGLSGIANLMIAAILFFGSFFVFLLLWVMFTIIENMRETERILAARYEEMKAELGQLTKDAAAVFRVNLTTDEIEERSGDFLYDTDFAADSYTHLLEQRQQYVLDRTYPGMHHELFTREGLLNHYKSGSTTASEIVSVRRKDGVPTFVRFEATLTKKPVSGDVIAFIVERAYNEEVVRQALLEKVLLDQYDRIAYIVGGRYKVLISNTGNTSKKDRLLLKDDEEDTYESIYLNVFLPAMAREKKTEGGGPNPLRYSVIERALAENESYEVNAPFMIDGVQRHKRFVFYRIDEKALFYLMLLSDSTQIQEEQLRKNRELEAALADAVRSNETRVRFFTNVSRDLRTPINAILDSAGLAKEESDPVKVKEYVEKIGGSGRQLLTYIDDMFTTNPLDSGTPTSETAPPDLNASSPDDAEKEAPLGPLKLLVADDNEINREIATLILETEGHTVVTAADGGEAVRMVSENEPGTFDAVLMDVQMPVMNGYEATAAIRALPDPARAKIPIIAMTANAFQEDQNAALAAGMDGYVSKPVSPEKIASALRNVPAGR